MPTAILSPAPATFQLARRPCGIFGRPFAPLAETHFLCVDCYRHTRAATHLRAALDFLAATDPRSRK